MPAPGDYWSSDSDPYIDPATGILKNIPNLATAAQLEAFEEVVFQAHFLEATQYAESCTSYSLDDWKTLHAICFADIYAWAGDLRTVRLKKGRTIFAYPENIESYAAEQFQELNEDMSAGRLTLERCAHYYGELNVLHPFREGNGRTQRILFAAILKRIGYQTHYERLESGPMIEALIENYHGRNERLEELFRAMTERIF